ncbi:MAG: S4 domain-containing protein [Fervidicoccus fontis]
MRLARELVTLFHGEEAAAEAEREFVAVFQKRELPSDMPVVTIEPSDLDERGEIWLPRLMVKAGLVESTSAGKRMIAQGGVKVNGEKIADPEAVIAVENGMVVQVGRRKFVRLHLNEE